VLERVAVPLKIVCFFRVAFKQVPGFEYRFDASMLVFGDNRRHSVNICKMFIQRLRLASVQNQEMKGAIAEDENSRCWFP
jgi:hypothetical protein